MPAFAGVAPSDGNAGSWSPQALEESRRSFHQQRLFIEQWIRSIWDDSRPQEDSQQQLHSDTMNGDELVQPWDSMSSTDRRPRHQARIQKHNERWNGLDLGDR